MSFTSCIYISVFCMLPSFSWAQNRYDIVISECMADPLPAAGLPPASFIELKNISTVSYNLRDWAISNGSTTAHIKTDYLLPADHFLILCPTAAVAGFSAFGATLGLAGFPSMNNTSGDLILRTAAGDVMDAIHYEKSWYNNVLKEAGGWTLEIIDPGRRGQDKSNWSASSDPLGGTPGKKNSVDAPNPDTGSPQLLRAVCTDSLHLLLIYDEPLDSLRASNPRSYTISPDLGLPDSIIEIAPFFDRVAIRLSQPLQIGKVYSVTSQELQDCSSNEIGSQNHCLAGLAEKASPGDLIFNEILFNPSPGGYDYLELYNRSKKTIDCNELFLAGKDIRGVPKDPLAISVENQAVFPGEYLLLTENPPWILLNYPKADWAHILPMHSLPSLPDDAGTVILLNGLGETIDELDYDHHWHAPLLANETGVALERIRPDLLPASQSSNWTSAAADAGFGTPSYKNSEANTDTSGTHFISIEPKIFSPDMDGYQDFCFIHYQMPAAGFMGSISIYDVNGRLVRQLINNTLWSSSGVFRWDGLGDQQNLLPIGHYVIFIEVFSIDGTVKKQTSVCTLARKR